MSPPRLSVVIVARDCAEGLHSALESLTAQTIEEGLFEVVVVDDGSREPLSDVLRRFNTSFPSRYIFQHRAGRASAKNLGFYTSTGEVVVFFDEHYVATPRLLEEILNPFLQENVDQIGVLGLCNPAPELRPDPLVEFVLESIAGPHVLADHAVSEVPIVAAMQCSSFACRRAFLVENGVFRQMFGKQGETLELAYRLHTRGLRLVRNPRAVSLLKRSPGFRETCTQQADLGRALWMLGQLHDLAGDPLQDVIDEAIEVWPLIEGSYADRMRSARSLGKLLRLQLELGIPVAAETWGLIRGECSWTLSASFTKGIFEASTDTTDTAPTAQGA